MKSKHKGKSKGVVKAEMPMEKFMKGAKKAKKRK